MSKNSWGLNKIAFWTTVIVALIYVVTMVLQLLGIGTGGIILSLVRSIATILTIVVVAIMGWRYVDSKPLVWRILYIICLILVVVGVIIPLI